MKALILAAGLGTRLRPLTEKTPKALLLVDGRPLIYYALKLLQKHGVRDVVVNLHHLGDLIQKEIGDGGKFGMTIRYSWEPEILGTGGGIKKAARLLDGDDFLVLNSDVLIDVNLKDLRRHHKKTKALATMVLRERDPDSSFTPVWAGRSDRIVHIGSSPPRTGKAGCFGSNSGENPDSPPNPHRGNFSAKCGEVTDQESKDTPPQKARPWHFTGIHYLESRFLGFLPAEGASCVIQQGYLPAIAAGENVRGYLYDGYWNDLGTFDRLREAEQDLRSGRVALSYLFKTSIARRSSP